MHASVNMGCQGKSGPGKIHEVILVYIQWITMYNCIQDMLLSYL